MVMMVVINDEGADDNDNDDNDDQIAGMQRSLWLPGNPLLAARWRDCHFLSGSFLSCKHVNMSTFTEKK